MPHYELAIGDQAYSSWSLRGWLMFEAFGLQVQTHRYQLYSDRFALLRSEFAPAHTVPALRLPDGLVVADSLAIAEELASRHPQAAHWPDAPRARAVARALACEMHAGFEVLRATCPMNLRVSYSDYVPDEALRNDLERLETLWRWARDECGGGPWLCGAYSVADAFFAPVAARIAGYSLPMSPEAQTYVATHLAHGPFRRWRAMGQVDGPAQPVYARDRPTRRWPGPEPLAAEAVEAGPPVNSACPYSGKPITDLARIGGRIWGFCNPFCRDKTVADAEAWPDFTAIYHS